MHVVVVGDLPEAEVQLEDHGARLLKQCIHDDRSGFTFCSFVVAAISRLGSYNPQRAMPRPQYSDISGAMHTLAP